jgi:hypothetical protein
VGGGAAEAHKRVQPPLHFWLWGRAAKGVSCAMAERVEDGFSPKTAFVGVHGRRVCAGGGCDGRGRACCAGARAAAGGGRVSVRGPSSVVHIHTGSVHRELHIHTDAARGKCGPLRVSAAELQGRGQEDVLCAALRRSDVRGIPRSVLCGGGCHDRARQPALLPQGGGRRAVRVQGARGGSWGRKGVPGSGSGGWGG